MLRLSVLFVCVFFFVVQRSYKFCCFLVATRCTAQLLEGTHRQCLFLCFIPAPSSFPISTYFGRTVSRNSAIPIRSLYVFASVHSAASHCLHDYLFCSVSSCVAVCQFSFCGIQISFDLCSCVFPLDGLSCYSHTRIFLE